MFNTFQTAAIRTLCLFASISVLATATWAQSSNGSTATTCTQSGTELTCTTVTKITLPSGASLQSGSVGTGNFQIVGAGSPGCSGLVANPATVAANTATSIALSIAGCAANSTFSWQAPAANTGTSTSSNNLTLSGANAAQQYSVTVCVPGATAAPGCQTYSTSVTLPLTLQGCTIAPAQASIQTNGSVNLSVSCTQGAGAGSGVTYQWRRDGQDIPGQTASAHAVSGSLGVGNYSYTVSLTNSAAPNAPVISASSSVNVTAVSGNVNWSNCGNINSPAKSFTWGTNLYTTWRSANHPGSTPYVVEINVPAYSVLPIGELAVLGFAPASGSGNRQVALSQTTPCDFNNLIPTAGSTSLNIGNDPSNVPTPNGVALTPGRWYFSFRSSPSNGSNITCGATQVCSMSMQWAP
jgi:hypothetical protein